MKKFTFKTEQPTGKYRSFSAPDHLIKYNGKVVGYFDSDISQDKFGINLQVLKTETFTDDNKNCSWKWLRQKCSFKTLKEAKTFLNTPEVLEEFFRKYTLYLD